MDEPRVVGIGASAGGVEALFDLVAGLDAGLDAAVVVVVHQAAGGPLVLPDLLDRRCALPVSGAVHGQRLAPAQVLVAPPDAHLDVRDGRVELRHGPPEKGHRPGIDPLFRSLALSAGPGAVGVVLSGLLDDGAAGLLDIVRHGGSALVQDPREALFDSMPAAALHAVPGARVVRARAVGAALDDLAARRPPGARHPSGRATHEMRVRRDEEPDDAVERALHAARQALEEKMAHAHRTACSAAARRAGSVSMSSRRSAHEAQRSATALRRLLFGSVAVSGGTEDDRDGSGGAR